MNNKKNPYEELVDLYYFSDLYQFFRESTGIAITLSYLILILSSMAYVHVLYSQFDISITKLLTLEDILATPIKNPDIIFVFTAITFVVYIADVTNRLNARLYQRYIDTKIPFYVRLLNFIAWTPKSKKHNIRLTIFIVLFALASYVYFFASAEAKRIKQGEGPKIEILYGDQTVSETVTLVGTTSQFVMIYDHKSDRAMAIQNESIVQFSPIKDKN